jgi:glycosyltransferase involved in cell wall biosynthesis
MRAYLQIRAALKQFRPQVVHTHSAKAGILGRYAAWSLKIPAVIHTVHGAPFHAYQSDLARNFYRWCETWAARRCHHLICVADAMRDLLVHAHVTQREHCTTIYSGMEIEPFVRANEHRAAMRANLGYNDEHVVIGKIARLSPLKGHEDLIPAARDLIARHPQVRFLLVGDGSLRDRLQQQVNRWGLHDHFRWTGLVPPDQIPQYIGAMDLLVHTSLREGLARALPQASLAGKPIVSYDLDGAHEVCLNDSTGILVTPRDGGGLITALARLVIDPSLREQLGAAGRVYCQTRFDHHQMTAQIRAVYEEVLSRSPRSL